MSIGPILVLDDDVEVVRLITTVLVQAGYRVISATDPREALRLAEQKPALVLADLMMPHLDGEAFVRALRSQLGDQMPPVVLITASLARGEIARRAGAAASVQKPFDLQDIRDLAHRFCGSPS
jgi:CheY-like chemotaxis protein